MKEIEKEIIHYFDKNKKNEATFYEVAYSIEGPICMDVVISTITEMVEKGILIRKDYGYVVKLFKA